MLNFSPYRLHTELSSFSPVCHSTPTSFAYSGLSLNTTAILKVPPPPHLHHYREEIIVKQYI